MEDQTASRGYDQRLLSLFDQYVHGAIDRRGFLDGAARFAAIGGVTASALLDALNPHFAEAQQIRIDDKRIKADQVEYSSPHGSGKMRGYLVHPAAARRSDLLAVLVIHENRGLNPHIEDIARRFAIEGFLAFAPDALTPLGGYPGDEDAARALFAKLDPAKSRADFIAAAAFLAARPDVKGKIGAVGFCWGGGVVNMLATELPDLGAGVPFYGSAPKDADVAKIKAPLLIHYAENDDRINAGAAAYEAALEKNHLRYEIHRYPGTQHGFNNDTTPRYDKAAAALAWKRTVDFLKANLGGGGRKTAP